jgi:hypothetical protein
MLSTALDSPKNNFGSVLVNEAFVKKFIPSGLDPSAQHLDDNGQPNGRTRIVGVVSGVRQNLMERSLPEMDYLITEIPQKAASSILSSENLFVRTSGDPKAIIPEIRQVFRQIDPTLPLREPRTMTEIISDQIVMQRMESHLFGTLSTLALLLAVVGLYGLISHEVEANSRDIGVRMALGASRGSVLRLVAGRVTSLLCMGIGVGLS